MGNRNSTKNSIRRNVPNVGNQRTEPADNTINAESAGIIEVSNPQPLELTQYNNVVNPDVSNVAILQEAVENNVEIHFKIQNTFASESISVVIPYHSKNLKRPSEIHEDHQSLQQINATPESSLPSDIIADKNSETVFQDDEKFNDTKVVEIKSSALPKIQHDAKNQTLIEDKDHLVEFSENITTEGNSLVKKTQEMNKKHDGSISITQPLDIPKPLLQPPELLTFSLNDFKKAPLICATLFEAGWKLNMGFTAESVFYKTNQLLGFQSEWVHDEGVFQLRSYVHDGIDGVSETVKKHALRLDFKYSSFVTINFEIEKSVKKNEYFNVKVTFVVEHPPLMFLEKPEAFKREEKCARFYHQLYHENVKSYWDDLIDASAFQLKYEIKKDKFDSWMSQLYSVFSSSISYNHLYEASFKNADLKQIEMDYWPWDTKYYIECIRSIGIVGKFFLEYRLFNQGEIRRIQYANKKITPFTNIILQSIYYFVKNNRSLSSLVFTAGHHIIPRQLGRDYVPIKTAYITPTRIMYGMEDPTVNNRGFRKLGADKILQIKFREDDLSWFPSDKNILNASMLTPLVDGLNVCGRQFFGFASSSSLFREHGIYFYATGKQEHVVEIIKKWAKFKVEPAAKTAARLGQYFTSAKEIKLKLKIDEIGDIPDYEYEGITDSTWKKYCFSDGVGLISPSYAKEIQTELGLSYTPSAFQIRCLGYKGMVSLHPYPLIQKGNEYKVLYRDTQNKFTSFEEGDIDFDIVQFSAPSPVKLHRSFIALLIALARDQGKEDVIEKRLHELLTKSFMDNIKALTDPETFKKTLVECIPRYFPISDFPAELLINEPFLRSLVEAYVVFNAKLLNKKCQIPLPESLGRSALGIVDTTGLLKPGEIYFQYTEDFRSKAANPNRRVHEGPIGITKSPMYHIGDIRYYTAVDHPELRHLYDVVVFPKVGNRPIPDEIGGGDLDGDTYVVFWDDDLLLKHADAAAYLAADTSKIDNVELENLHREHANFRVEYEECNNLEKLSNCHVNHITVQHPNHPEVEKISNKADIAVNYFKSGLKADEIEPHEYPVFNPIYMDKRHEPAYSSSHILCQLHKRCNTFYTLMVLALQQAQNQRSERHMPELDVSDDARNLFADYKNEITNLMKRFKIKTEAELFADVLIEVPGVFNTFKLTTKDEQDAVTSEIRANLTTIFKSYRIGILNRFFAEWESDMKARDESFFAYKITHVPEEMKNLAKEYYDLAQNNGECLSFPWIAFEGLELKNGDDKPSLGKKLLKEIKKRKLSEDVASMSSPFYNKKYSHFDWFGVAVEAWMDKEDVYQYRAYDLIQLFFNNLINVQDRNEDSSVIKTFADAFKDFLTMICSLKFDKITDDPHFEKVYKAAQSTLIEMAFSPDLPILTGQSLQKREIPYPAFVISVPKMYSLSFQDRYPEILRGKRNLENLEIAIRLRNQNRGFCRFTICCRATLSQCQELEALLTPIFEYDDNPDVTMAQMKERKTITMQKLLEDQYGFTPPLFGDLPHARTTAGEIQNGNPHDRSRNGSGWNGGSGSSRVGSTRRNPSTSF